VTQVNKIVLVGCTASPSQVVANIQAQRVDGVDGTSVVACTCSRQRTKIERTLEIEDHQLRRIFHSWIDQDGLAMARRDDSRIWLACYLDGLDGARDEHGEAVALGTIAGTARVDVISPCKDGLRIEVLGSNMLDLICRAVFAVRAAALTGAHLIEFALYSVKDPIAGLVAKAE